MVRHETEDRFSHLHRLMHQHSRSNPEGTYRIYDADDFGDPLAPLALGEDIDHEATATDDECDEQSGEKDRVELPIMERGLSVEISDEGGDVGWGAGVGEGQAGR